jgi:bifunctional aspartokinase / homoserine dehydrogenase 1
MSLITHKFGGSSLADANCIAHVARLLSARSEDDQVIVVSAMAGVTNELIALTQEAAAGTAHWEQRLGRLETRHLETAAELLPASAALDELTGLLKARFATLGQLLASLGLMGSAPQEVIELVSGLGEVFSAELLGATSACRMR